MIVYLRPKTILVFNYDARATNPHGHGQAMPFTHTGKSRVGPRINFIRGSI